MVLLVENNAPSIVEISTTKSISGRSAIGDDEIEELLRRLNPDQEPDLDIEGMPEQRQRGAVGSGFLISTDGYIMTNNHVVADASEIQVTLNDRRVYDAKVIGLDEPSDLALLKIDVTDLPYVEFGNSDSLRVGDWVLAIGSPFGLEFSAAAGIVSAKGVQCLEAQCVDDPPTITCPSSRRMSQLIRVIRAVLYLIWTAMLSASIHRF